MVDVDHNQRMALTSLHISGAQLARYLAPVWRRAPKPPPAEPTKLFPADEL
jgi:hypothetical protein